MRRAELIAQASRALAGLALMILIGALPWLSRRDPAAAILRTRYAEAEPSPEALEAIRQQLGLADGPLATSMTWWSGVLRGDLGYSWVSGRPVGPGVLSALGVSASLMFAAIVVALVVCALVATPALRQVALDRPIRGAGAVAVALTSLPEFLLANVLLILLAVRLQWLPVYGWGTPAQAVLPALALGLPAGGLLGRLFSDAIGSSSAERWVEVWRLAGASTAVITLGVLRRATAAVIDQVGLVLVGLLGGAVAVEQVFAIPGIGRVMLGAANSLDLPPLQACVLLVAAAALGIGIAIALIRRAILGGPLPPGGLHAPVEPPRDQRLAKRILLGATALLALILVGGLPRDPYAVAFPRLTPPSLALPFGSDASGRDLLARVAHGALTSLGTASVLVLAATLVALAVAFWPQAARGPIEIANATPPIIAGIVVAAMLGPSPLGAALAVLWVSWPPLASHAAALIAEARSMQHIRWLPLSGAGGLHIAVRHVVPLVALPLLKHATLRLPGVALALASLGFLGLGTRPPAPEWGLVMAEGMAYVERAPWATLTPTLALVLASVIASASAALTGPGERRSRSRGARNRSLGERPAERKPRPHLV